VISRLETDGKSAMEMLSALLDILAVHGVEVQNDQLNPSSEIAAALCESGESVCPLRISRENYTM
jgi:hypothetical protein